MEFYKTVRVDGLIKREETPKSMTEYYEGRPDFLSYRLVNFGPRVKKITLNSTESNPRTVLVSTYWAPGTGCLLALAGWLPGMGAAGLRNSVFPKLPLPSVPSATRSGRYYFPTVVKSVRSK